MPSVPLKLQAKKAERKVDHVVKRRFHNSCHVCKCGASPGIEHVRCRCGIMYCGRPRCCKRLNVEWAVFAAQLLRGEQCAHCRALVEAGVMCPNSNCKQKKKKGLESRKYSVGIVTSAQEVQLDRQSLPLSSTASLPVSSSSSVALSSSLAGPSVNAESFNPMSLQSFTPSIGSLSLPSALNSQTSTSPIASLPLQQILAILHQQQQQQAQAQGQQSTSPHTQLTPYSMLPPLQQQRPSLSASTSSPPQPPSLSSASSLAAPLGLNSSVSSLLSSLQSSLNSAQLKYLTSALNSTSYAPQQPQQSAVQQLQQHTAQLHQLQQQQQQALAGQLQQRSASLGGPLDQSSAFSVLLQQVNAQQALQQLQNQQLQQLQQQQQAQQQAHSLQQAASLNPLLNLSLPPYLKSSSGDDVLLALLRQQAAQSQAAQGSASSGSSSSSSPPALAYLRSPAPSSLDGGSALYGHQHPHQQLPAPLYPTQQSLYSAPPQPAPYNLQSLYAATQAQPQSSQAAPLSAQPQPFTTPFPSSSPYVAPLQAPPQPPLQLQGVGVGGGVSTEGEMSVGSTEEEDERKGRKKQKRGRGEDGMVESPLSSEHLPEVFIQRAHTAER